MNTINKSRIFISYSHRGKGPVWKAKLLRALHVFEQQHLLDVWQDGKIRVSAFWDDDIRKAMSSAQIAVVLLTREALEARPAPEANYILDTEFPFLRELHRQGKLTVFPVICEDCGWRAHDWLRATQAPNESNPLAQLSDTSQDEEFRKLATSIAEELSHKALAENLAPRVPQSEFKTYLDKFPITRGPAQRKEKLIGREQELALLDLAFAQPHTAIVSLVAWGGVGKTMLVQHWLQLLQREDWFGARCVYAWSFYSQGTKEDRQASEDTFLAHALEWFGVQCEPTLSPWDKGRLLADAVSHERTLLILDGIEPLQYPPGPMGGQLRAPGVQSLLNQLARKANSEFRSQNPEVCKGLCLVTTREPLTDLADFQRRPDAAWGSVLHVDLGNLTTEAGAALLHHAGAHRAGAAEIKPDDKELLAASREVDGHALTLNLLGRFLDRAHGGDIRRRDLVKFEEADRKEQGGTTFRMLSAFENWFANEGDIEARALTVLHLLGLFDRPADTGCIAALRKPPIIAGLTEPLFTLKRDSNTGQAIEQPLSDKAWNDATHFLSDFGLISTLISGSKVSSSATSDLSLDCHPLIREYFAKKIRAIEGNGWCVANIRLFGYLAKSVPQWPSDLKGLEPLYQAVFHGCQAGKRESGLYEYVLAILKYRIMHQPDGKISIAGGRTFSTDTMGAVHQDLVALANLFEQPWSVVAHSLSDSVKGWVFNQTSFRLRLLGRISEACEPTRLGLEITISSQDSENAMCDAVNMSELEALSGNIDEAIRLSEVAMNLAKPMSNNLAAKAWLICAQARKACALLLRGRLLDAEAEFVCAEKNQNEFDSQHPLLYGLSGCQYSDLILASDERLAWSNYTLPSIPRSFEGGMHCLAVRRRMEETIKWLVADGQILQICFTVFSWARARMFATCFNIGFFSTEDVLTEVRTQIEPALKEVRTLHSAEFLVEGLMAHSILFHMLHDKDSARSDLDEAWDIASRGPIRLHMADIHLYRARLFFREKHYPWKSPQADLAAAENLINVCGYHRRDDELNDAKKAILGTK